MGEPFQFDPVGKNITGWRQAQRLDAKDGMSPTLVTYFTRETKPRLIKLPLSCDGVLIVFDCG